MRFTAPGAAREDVTRPSNKRYYKLSPPSSKQSFSIALDHMCKIILMQGVPLVQSLTHHRVQEQYFQPHTCAGARPTRGGTSLGHLRWSASLQSQGSL